MDLTQRSSKKELLDQPGIPFSDIEKNMRELDTINSLLGGHAISVAGLKKIANGRNRLTICEIGCGGGDNLRALNRWCERKGIKVEFIGVDNNDHCIAVAKRNWPGENALWIHADYREARFGDKKPDIIFSSLFCHHFTNDELIGQVKWMDERAALGWYINDLHRHLLAYHSIRILTKWFSGSYLVKNDAPLSVLRGFKKQEWVSLFDKAGISGYSIRWKWAFRWLIMKHRL